MWHQTITKCEGGIRTKDICDNSIVLTISKINRRPMSEGVRKWLNDVKIMNESLCISGSF